MQLLYTATAYPPSTGGAQIHHHLLAQSLQAEHTIQALCHWANDRTDWLLGTTLRAPQQTLDYMIDGIPVHRLGLSRGEKAKLLLPVLGYYPLMSWALPQIVEGLKPHLRPYAAQADLIHNVRIGREGLSLASFAIAREYDIPFVFTPVHHPRWIGWPYQAYIELYQKADVVIALTHAEKDTLTQLQVAADRIFVTGIGPVLASSANPQQFLAKHPIDGPFVLFLGQHYHYKGYRQLLQAARQVWEKQPETHFVFMGPPIKNSDHLFQAISDRRIHRLGKVDLQEKTDALAACTLLCVPSTQESFGGVYTEAWSFAKPVIGCNIPAVAEVITEGIDGYLVAQRSGEIAERIYHLLLHPAQAQQMGQNGQRKVQERYSWSQLAKRTVEAYATVL